MIHFEQVGHQVTTQRRRSANIAERHGSTLKPTVDFGVVTT
ncbi:hypothetical protein [Candidatus Methylobacter favarea]|nr:hypothetical protein [Candidatus Methylobacter favarea]